MSSERNLSISGDEVIRLSGDKVIGILGDEVIRLSGDKVIGISVMGDWVVGVPLMKVQFS